jgi:putative membrane protein
MHDGWMFGMAWVWILALLVVACGIWIALRAGTRSDAGSDRSVPDKAPEDILRERLARGEIDENEYRSRMEALREER